MLADTPIMEFPTSCSSSVESSMPARILIVDDEPELRELLSESLVARGYVTEAAETGAAAITAVRTQPRPDVVLLDLNMPGALDGRAVLRQIGQEIPVIIVTSISDVEDARAQLQAGAFDFISKPFDLERVAEVVAAAVAYRSGPSE
jgi:CheY-like chemotaxis protein